jgi:hypothetical protein
MTILRVISGLQAKRGNETCLRSQCYTFNNCMLFYKYKYDKLNIGFSALRIFKNFPFSHSLHSCIILTVVLNITRKIMKF